MNNATSHNRLPELTERAYAPYDGPEDYIMSWTDRIWEPRGMGQINDHYDPDIPVHGASGTIVGNQPIIRACLQKNAAFPNRLFTGEDVIWEKRSAESFISSHRIINCGRQEGPWHYGPATFKYSTSRNVALCLVRDAMVVEEWVVRDEWAVAEQSGHDVDRVTTEMALAPRADLFGTAQGRLLGDPPTDPLHEGVSGRRDPSPHGDDVRVLEMIDQVWNGHRREKFLDYFSRDVVIEATRQQTYARHTGYKDTLDQLFGPFPDAVVNVYDVAVNDHPFFGRRVSVLWVLEGTYSGTPIYGPVTGSPVEVLGISHFQMRDDVIWKEWRIFDEMALWAQIKAARPRVEG